MIGLYPLSNSTVIDEPYESVSAFLASISATVPTTLPNYLISTPTYTTPAYTFNTSVSATPGKIVKSGLATSTYSALLGTKNPNASAIATLTPSPTVATPSCVRDVPAGAKTRREVSVCAPRVHGSRPQSGHECSVQPRRKSALRRPRIESNGRGERAPLAVAAQL